MIKKLKVKVKKEKLKYVNLILNLLKVQKNIIFDLNYKISNLKTDKENSKNSRFLDYILTFS